MTTNNNHNDGPKLDFNKSYAFIIGIDQYTNVTPLESAVNDAKQLAKVLKQEQGFEVHPPLIDATGVDIKRLLEEMIPGKVTDQRDRVLFYFSGHGIALDGENGPAGYLVPADAERINTRSLISMDELHNSLMKLPCKHMLVILDCCFAGTFKWSSGFRDFTMVPKRIYKERFDRYIKDPAWQVITSAAYDQKALDVLDEKALGNRGKDSTQGNNHSPFARALFNGLAGKADIIPAEQGDGVITATELYIYLRDQIEPQTIEYKEKYRQTPRIFPLEKHDKGEFIFLHPYHRLNLPPIPQRNPYKGLLSFEFKKEDIELFYGREKVIEHLMQKVSENNLVVVTGASGTGKSSVVKAGLAPELEKQGYEILPVMRPGSNPIAALGEVFRESNLLDDHISADNEMTLIINKLAPDKKRALVIDQYEELITQCRNEGERNRFTKILKNLLDADKKDLLKIIITIRSDYEPQFEDEELKNYWQQGRYTVPPFSQDELREIILKPANQEVLVFEPETLVEDIINEVIQAPGALPLLSFTLSELYRLSIQNGRSRVLHEDDYKELGGVVGALRTKADNLYNSLDIMHQKTMRKIMLRMVSLEGGELAGKRVMLDELSYENSEENERVETIIKKLLDARLIVKNIDSNNLPYIEPAHDALIKSWATLWKWIKTIGEDQILLQNSLNEAVRDYRRLNDDRLLWNNDPRLEFLQIELKSSETWLNKDEVDFVKKSIQRKKQRKRRFITTLISIIIVLTGLTTFAIYKAIEANNKARKSEANRLATIATQKAKEDPTVALRIAERAWQLEKTENVIKSINRIYTNRSNSFYKIVVRHDKRHDKPIRDVAFSPDGKTILTGSNDKTARLWDLEGNVIQEFKGHDGMVLSVAFSPDGKTILTGSDDKTARLWDLEGNVIREFNGHDNAVFSVAFSPEGKSILTGSGDKTARLWNLEGNVIQKFRGHNFYVLSVAFSPDGKTILTGSGDSTARLWDLEGNVIQKFKGHTTMVLSVAFSPDGKTIITGSMDKTVRLWNLQGIVTRNFSGHDAAVLSVAFSPDGKTILTGGMDKTACLWDLEENVIQEFKGHTDQVLSVAFSPDGKTILTSSQDSTVRSWDLEGNVIQVFKGHANAVFSVAFSPEGKTILTGSWDKTARLWDLEGKVIQVFNGHTAKVSSVAFSPDGKTILTGSWDKTARLWDIEGNVIQVFNGHNGPVLSVAFSPDGNTILTGSDDRTARLWDLEGKVIQVFNGNTSEVLSVAFSPDGKTFLTGYWDKTARLWDLEGHVIREFKAYGVNSRAFSPNRKTILTRTPDKTVHLGDFQGNIIQVFRHNSDVASVAFSPKGNSILTGTFDGTARLWKIMTVEDFLKKGNFEKLTKEQKKKYGIEN